MSVVRFLSGVSALCLVSACSSDASPPVEAGLAGTSGALSSAGNANGNGGGSVAGETSTAGAAAETPASGGESGAATSVGGAAVGGAGGAAGESSSGGGVGGAAGGAGAPMSSAGAGSAGRAGTAGAAGGTAIDPNQIDVFLIGGQSNATGQGYMKNVPSSFVVDTKVQIYHSADIISGGAANTWIPLRHASEAPDSCGDRFGPELGFGNNIHSFYADRQIAIIKHAKSATNLVSQWSPGSNAADSAHFGGEFKTFVQTVDGGLKALRDKGKQPVIRAMLWQQGENDADIGGTAASDYGKHLSALIARVREQWNAPNMLFVYGYVYPKSNYGTGRDQVRAGEKNVDQDSGNALAVKRAFVVETDDLELRANDANSCYKSDLVHFGTAGQLELGRRMAIKAHDKLGPSL